MAVNPGNGNGPAAAQAQSLDVLCAQALKLFNARRMEVRQAVAVCLMRLAGTWRAEAVYDVSGDGLVDAGVSETHPTPEAAVLGLIAREKQFASVDLARARKRLAEMTATVATLEEAAK